jgi:hypothetical protein
MTTQDIYSAEEAQRKLDTLPDEVKKLLYSPEMLTAIRKVGEKNQLHIDQIGVLQTETTAVMLGFTEMKDFPKKISKNIDVDETKSIAIAKDVDEILFSKIRGQMKTNDAVPTQPAVEGKSVVMPSASKMADVKPASAPTTPPTPVAPSAPPVTPAAPKPTTPTNLPSIEMNKAEVMLTQPTVSIAPKNPASSSEVLASSKTVPPAAPVASQDPTKTSATPPPPPVYKTDPYREPPE